MKFICPICSNIEDFCTMDACKKCHHQLRQGYITLADFDSTVEAEAIVIIGLYSIEGNSRSVAINKNGRTGWRKVIVENVSIGIDSFVGMDEKLLERFIANKDWGRLKKARVLL